MGKWKIKEKKNPEYNFLLKKKTTNQQLTLYIYKKKSQWKPCLKGNPNKKSEGL